MTEWKKVVIDDICDIKSGKRLPKGTDFSLSETPYRYIRARDIKDGRINGDHLAYISSDVREKIKKYIVKPNDIAITIVGASIGDVAYVNSEFNDVNLTENAVRLTNFKEGVNPHFVFYILNSSRYCELLNKKAGGAAQPKLGIYKIKNIELSLPSFDVQNTIELYLSKYDSLIENYQQQIKLLEEAAQRLYKEWFVDLHFPGYENTKIVDGVPEGWEKRKANDYFPITIGRTPPRKESEWFTKGNGIPWVSISDMKPASFIGETSESLTDEAVNRFNVVVVPKGTVLLSFKLTVGRTCITQVPVCTNEAIAHFVTDNTGLRYYTLLYLRNFNFDSLGNTSGISKAINSTIVKNMPFIMPPKSILGSFRSLVAPILTKVDNLTSQIRLLTEARDRLLPKLMSGEIAVEKDS